jgi:hypothetical protein
MNLPKRSALVGVHALLSPSEYHWLNYDDDKMDRVYHMKRAAQRGTELHALAHELIRLGVKLPDVPKTLNMYVNDGVGFKMDCEQVLFYSDNCFGTVDCIRFRNNTLRIHDLKTGVTEASMKQLEIYAALFCLDCLMSPFDINIELRIYQNDSVKVHVPEPTDIMGIMQKIKYYSHRIEALKEDESS